MYLVKAGDVVIHDGMINDRDYVALSGTMKTEYNRAGTFSFSVPPNNWAHSHNDIKKLSSIIKVWDRYGTLKWKGRVLDTAKDFYGRMTYNCEGWLSVLNDSVVRPSVGDALGGNKDKGITQTPVAIFRALINSHNSQVESAKQFTVNIIGISNSVNVTLPYPNYETTLDYIQNNFLANEDIGGLLYVSDTALNYIADGVVRGRKSKQPIVFGRNLLELADTKDASELYTVILPVGKDGLTLSKTAGQDIYPSSADSNVPSAITSAINTFGRIIHYEEFSDVSSVSVLKDKAKNMLLNSLDGSFIIEATAFDLGIADQDIGNISVGTYVSVFSPPHDLTGDYPCTAAEIDICNPANSKFTFGTNPDTLTTKQAKLARKVNTHIEYVEEVPRIDMAYSIFEEAVAINNITFYRAGNNVYLSFAVKFLKVVPNDRASILTFNNKYAPDTNEDTLDAVTDETTDMTYRIRVTTDGKIQVFNDSEIAIDDIVTASVSWVYT